VRARSGRFRLPPRRPLAHLMCCWWDGRTDERADGRMDGGLVAGMAAGVDVVVVVVVVGRL